jgi:hypothetical protein
MRVLFDNGVPRGVASVLKEHVVEEARDRGWDRLTNGDLLRAAEVAGFEILLTTDRNIRYQQNLSKRVIAIIALSKGSWPLIKRSCPRSRLLLLLQLPAATRTSRFPSTPISAAAEFTATTLDRLHLLPTMLSCSSRWHGLTARRSSQEPRRGLADARGTML